MKKGITIVFIANVLNMLFSVAISFILPKYLSIESYGYYKVFQLYLNYLGLAHLGFADGIYLKYGGENIASIEPKEIQNEASTIRNMQLLISVLAVIVSIVIKNPIAIFLSLSLIPVNMVSFYKNLFQATGEFKNYSIVITVIPLIMFVCNMFLVFVSRTDNYLFYIAVSFLANLLIYMYLEMQGRRRFGRFSFFAFDIRSLINNIKLGISLTIGNFASILITSIDRWCIQALMTITDFSYYSFAVSVENLFNVCVSAVTTTLYNYLCKEKNVYRICRIRNYCAIIGVYLVAVAFPVKYIIHIWLQKYSESIPCLFILICAHSFYFVIKAIYVNLYKARGQQKHYLYQMIIVLGIAVVTNLFAYFCISKTKESFAYASLATAAIWYFMCFSEFPEIRGKIRESFALVITACIYLITGLLIENALVGLIIYLGGSTIVLYLLVNIYFKDFIRMASGIFSKKIVGCIRRRH